MDNLENIVKSIFQSNKFQINEKNRNKLIISNIIFKNECIIMTIDKINNLINIDYIKKCASFSGTELLTRIKKLCDLLKFRATLEDESTFFIKENCFFDLSLFHILNNGESWYNKYGFISEYYDKEKENNIKLTNMSLLNIIFHSLDLTKENKMHYGAPLHNKRYPSSWKERINSNKNEKIIKMYTDKINECMKHKSYEDFLEYENKKIIEKLIPLPNIFLLNGINIESIVKDVMDFLKIYINTHMNNLNSNDIIIKWLFNFLRLVSISVRYYNTLFYTPSNNKKFNKLSL